MSDLSTAEPPAAHPGPVAALPVPDPVAPPTTPHLATEPEHGAGHGPGYLATLALGALGVVYGDIGTSPLYSVRESLHGSHPIPCSPENVTGVISLVFWSLVIIVCIKYLFLVLRADHHGEGGVLALTAKVGETTAGQTRFMPFLLMLGLFGTALIYGDGMITPAISVLSAVEGLEVITPVFKPYVIPGTIVILTLLFSIQSRGTGSMGRVFGPIMLVWFLTLAALGIYQLVQQPAILSSLNPAHGLQFFGRNGWGGVLVLGSIFLVVTGGEALYADMGHFGRKPIQMAWFFVAFPALVLNYLGQGALLLRNPEAVKNPFFLMAPSWALAIVVVLATVATVVASQALISGVFSLAMQSVQLGYLPRLKVLHTSAKERGQIYVPAANWLLMLACIGLVLGFRTSSDLAAAYGVAVTATMVITTCLFYVLLTQGWKWSWGLATLVCGFFLTLEFTFLAANISKIPEGGWFPLVIGWCLFMAMSTWKIGRGQVFQMLQARTVPLRDLLTRLQVEKIYRVPGTAVFMYGNRTGTPPALLANIRHNCSLHQRVIVLAVVTAAQPLIQSKDRMTTEVIGDGFYRVCLHYGYMEKPDVTAALSQVNLEGQPFVLEDSTFFLGRETVIPCHNAYSQMSYWREVLFATMTRNALDATSFYAIPPDRVVEVGTQLEI